MKKNAVAKALKGVKLHFTNNLQTEPLPSQVYQRDRNEEYMKTVKIDPKRKIGRISMGISICDSIVAI